MYEKRILCLANSRKITGRCIAGRELVGSRYGGWVRPVSDRPSAEVSEEERRFQDGSDPQVLQIIDVPLLEAKPHHHQVENELLDPTHYWAHVRNATWQDVQRAVERPTRLWENVSSTYHGIFDRIPEASAIQQTASLYLIQPADVTVRVLAPGAAFGDHRRKVRARFTYNNVVYDLTVTDPVIEREFLAEQDGQYPLDNAILCVSLGEAYEGFAYKLVATILTPDRVL